MAEENYDEAGPEVTEEQAPAIENTEFDDGSAAKPKAKKKANAKPKVKKDSTEKKNSADDAAAEG